MTPRVVFDSVPPFGHFTDQRIVPLYELTNAEKCGGRAGHLEHVEHARGGFGVGSIVKRDSNGS